MNLVSIIVPCYNYGHLLPYTLDSILSQSYQNWEAVIIDDGSADNTREVTLSYQQRDPRFRYVHQTNSGLSSARNTGIKNALGDFIIFLDADDLISEEKIRAHVDHFSQSDAIDISYSSALYFAHDRPQEFYKRSSLDQRPWMPKISGRGYEALKELVSGNIMPVSSPCMRRRVIDQLVGFDESLPCMEDWEYWLRCALNGFSFFYLEDEKCATFIRVQKQSLSKNLVRMADNELGIRKLLTHWLNRQHTYLVSPEQLASLHTLNSLHAFKAQMRSGNYNSFLKFFKSSINLSTSQKVEIATADLLRFVRFKLSTR